MNDEAKKVAERYERRKESELVKKITGNTLFSRFILSERESKYSEIIESKFSSLEGLKVLEIGAGEGGNINFFRKLGLQWENIHANELLPDRFKVLSETYPKITKYEGDAFNLDSTLNQSFDIVFQSTVFTSILDAGFKQKLAGKMWDLVKPGGIVLWYDFSFDNPKNKDVKGIKKQEIRNLFKEAKSITFDKTTLAPPIGRRVGKMYPVFNAFPFLRTHLIAVIEKG
jgi:ubiquinone/menaquinone biosynthesis C-methylase UbiE